MPCPECGSEAAPRSGRCPACGAAALPDAPTVAVATGVLTPAPPTGVSASDAGTRLGTSSTGQQTTPGSATDPNRSGASGPLQVGQTFGARYHVIKLLGSGGMGAVYQAWDAELGVAVALKVIRPEMSGDSERMQDLERRFKRELLLARQVTHKNVVRIHDLGEINGVKYITMPYLQGSDLGAILRQQGKLSVPRTLAIARQVVSGLAAAHEVGVVHRDLKPANIMVDIDDHACIVDFGIARSVSGSSATVAGLVVGTLEYMAPEQALAQPVDQRADIYAFGLILRDMLVGPRLAARAESAVAELMARMQHAPPLLRSVDQSIPEAVEQLVARCIEPDPAFRYQTTAELAADIERLHAGGRSAAQSAFAATLSRTRVGTAKPAWWQRSRWRFGAPAAALALILLGALVVYRGRSSPGPDPGTAAGSTPAVTSLAILPFRNASGDPALDWLGASLAEMLRTDVGQSGSLRAVSSDRIHEILTDLRIAPGATLDGGTIGRLAEFTNAQTVLSGQYIKAGLAIRIDAQLQDRRGSRIVPLKVEAPDEKGILTAVADLARLVRQNAATSNEGVSALAGKSFKPSSESLDAIRAYNEGLALARQGKHLEALKRFEAATRADPKFALAFSKLGETYANLSYDKEAEQFSRQASELSESLPPQEKYLIQASYARIRNDYDSAIQAYEQLIAAAPDNPAFNFELARLRENTGDFDKARTHYQKVLEQDPKYVDALLSMGRVEIKAGNYQGSLDYLSRAQNLAIELGNEEARAAILNAIGIAYKRLNKLEEALAQYRQSLEIKRKLGQKGGIAASLTEIAQIQGHLGKPEEAIKSFDEALRLRREIGDKRGIGNTLIDYGSLLVDRGNYDQALNFYRESLEIQRQVGNASYEALCLNNIASIYEARGNHDDALAYFQRALTIREKSGNQSDIAESLHNLAETSGRNGQYEHALDYYLRALQLRRAAGDQRQAAINSAGMAGIFQSQGRYGAAVKAREEAVQTLRQLQDRSYLFAEILRGYGDSLVLVGRFDEAKKVFEEARTLARQLGNQALIAQIINGQGAEAYERGDWRAAQTLFAQAVKDSTAAGDRQAALAASLNLSKVAMKEGGAPSVTTTLTSQKQEAERLGLRYLALESSTWLAEALINNGQYPKARAELEGTLRKSEELGLRMLVARGRYLQALMSRRQGNAVEARAHALKTLEVLDAIRKEVGTADLMKRVELKGMEEEASRWSKGLA